MRTSSNHRHRESVDPGCGVRSLLAAVIALSCATGARSAEVVADSVVQFSGEQGKDGWTYGCYSVDLDGYQPADFQPLPNHVAEISGVSSWWLEGFNVAPWVAVFDNRMHSGASPFRHSVRRWTSDRAALIEISGVVRKHQDGLGGDGVRAYIVVDGAVVYEQTLDGLDGTGFDYEVLTSVFPGSSVDFMLDPKDSSNLDTTVFTASIVDLGEDGPSYGDGCPGSGGFVPKLEIEGTPGPGDRMDVRITSGLGSSFAMLMVGTDRAALPLGYGCYQYVAPLLPITMGPVWMTAGGPGAGSFTGKVKLPKSTLPLLGVTLQAIIYDLGTPTGAAYSNGYELVFPKQTAGSGKKGKKAKKKKGKKKALGGA